MLAQPFVGDGQQQRSCQDQQQNELRQACCQEPDWPTAALHLELLQMCCCLPLLQTGLQQLYHLPLASSCCHVNLTLALVRSLGPVVSPQQYLWLQPQGLTAPRVQLLYVQRRECLDQMCRSSVQHPAMLALTSVDGGSRRQYSISASRSCPESAAGGAVGVGPGA